MYNEIEGDLIELALAGTFNVVAHGCNCFCLQGAGIALQMRETFATNAFSKEHPIYKGKIDRLGTIDFKEYGKDRITKEVYKLDNILDIDDTFPIFYVVNAYTQYQPGSNLDYEALTLCLRKINHVFKGKHIGLPQIGAGIAAGDWNKIKTIIQQELKDCDVTVVIYNK